MKQFGTALRGMGDENLDYRFMPFFPRYALTDLDNGGKRITCEINNSFHSQEELRVLMSRLTGKVYPKH